MNPQQPPYQPYPPQPGWQPMPGGQPSGGYPYPQPTGGYRQPTGQQPWPPMPPQPAPRRHRKWPWVVGGIVVFLIVVSAINGKPSGSRTSTTPTVVDAAPAASQAQAGVAAPAPAPAAPSGPATSFDDGTYHVGVDIVAGRYKTPGPSPDAIFKDCYWERTKDDSGQFGSIISNGNAVGPGYVTVKNGEFFQTSGGCTWTKQ